MGRRGIGPADVVRACVALKRQRRSVDLRNLRLELARGSYSTIAKYLRQLALVEIKEDSLPAQKHRYRRLEYKYVAVVDPSAVEVAGVSEGV